MPHEIQRVERDQARRSKRRAGSRCRCLRSGPSRGRGDGADGDLCPAILRLQHGSGGSRIPLGRPLAQRHEVARDGDGDVLRPGARRDGAGLAVHDPGAEPGVLRQRPLDPLRLRPGLVRTDRVPGDRGARRLVEREQRERVRVGSDLGTMAPGDQRLAGPAGGNPGSARAQHELGDRLQDQRRLHEPGNRTRDRDRDPAARGRLVDRDHDLPGAPRRRVPSDLPRQLPRRLRHDRHEPLPRVHERPAGPLLRVSHQQRVGRPLRDRRRRRTPAARS